MVHNGIEYGLMAAYAEGLNILSEGQHRRRRPRRRTPRRRRSPTPSTTSYDFDLGAITELWRRGSVVSSWLLDLTAAAFVADPELSGFEGRVSDSGEGRWTVHAAIDEGVPAPVLSAALYERFYSRGRADMANKILSAMRAQFGGHAESKSKQVTDERRHATRRRCAGAVRRHRRPGQAQAVPGAVPPRTTRHAEGAGHRRGPQRLDRQGVLRARPRRDHRRHPRRQGRGDRRADGPPRPHPGRLRRPEDVEHPAQDARQAQEQGRRVLHGHPADDVPLGRPVAGLGGLQRPRPHRGREAVRPRPGQRQGAQRDAARGVPRGAHLPHRSLPRQGERRGPAGLPLLEHLARAGVEPQLRAQRADHDERDHRRRGARQLLRRRRQRSAT